MFSRSLPETLRVLLLEELCIDHTLEDHGVLENGHKPVVGFHGVLVFGPAKESSSRSMPPMSSIIDLPPSTSTSRSFEAWFQRLKVLHMPLVLWYSTLASGSVDAQSMGWAGPFTGFLVLFIFYRRPRHWTRCRLSAGISWTLSPSQDYLSTSCTPWSGLLLQRPF